MAGIGRLFMEARLAEMRVELSLKKPPAAYTKRCLYGHNTFPARVADLPFVGRFEQS
jgi:hypothetical protein